MPGRRPTKPTKLPLTLGQLHQRLARDVAADFLRRDVDERRFGRDGHGFFNRPDRHRHVDARRLADLEAQILALELLEALKLRVHLVGSRDESAGDERAVGSGDRLAEHAGFLVFHDDGHARQYRILRVDDPTAKFGRALLCRRRHGDEQGHHADQAHDTLLHITCLLSLPPRKSPYSNGKVSPVVSPHHPSQLDELIRKSGSGREGFLDFMCDECGIPRLSDRNARP